MLSQNKEESEDSNLPSDIHIGTVVRVSVGTCACARAHTHRHKYKHKYEWAVILVKSHSVHISGLSGHAVSASANQLCHCGHQAIMDSKQASEHSSKLY